VCIGCCRGTGGGGGSEHVIVKRRSRRGVEAHLSQIRRSHSALTIGLRNVV